MLSIASSITWEAAQFLEEAMFLLNSFNEFPATWSPRRINTAAHELAKYALEEYKNGSFQISELPLQICNMISIQN